MVREVEIASATAAYDGTERHVRGCLHPAIGLKGVKRAMAAAANPEMFH